MTNVRSVLVFGYNWSNENKTHLYDFKFYVCVCAM